MKKIMFNDQFGLTKAVLSGSKTMTRRVAYNNDIVETYRTINFVHKNKLAMFDGWEQVALSRYGVGEIVAIAQSYHSLIESGCIDINWLDYTCDCSAGYENKMFVRADVMPYGIKISDIKVERLQDISRDDILREGIQYDVKKDRFMIGNKGFYFAKEAFAYLIDRTLGNGTYEKNPWVFVYTFQLVKF